MADQREPTNKIVLHVVLNVYKLYWMYFFNTQSIEENTGLQKSNEAMLILQTQNIWTDTERWILQLNVLMTDPIGLYEH